MLEHEPVESLNDYIDKSLLHYLTTLDPKLIHPIDTLRCGLSAAAETLT